MSRDHSELKLLLDDYVDRSLDDGEAREVALHLEDCAECAAEVELTRELLAAARSLPAEVQPPSDLWDGIRGRISPRAAENDARVIALRVHRPGAGSAAPWLRRAAAAAALVVLSSGATAYLLTRGAGGQRVAVTGPAPASTASTASSPPSSAEPAVPATSGTRPAPASAPERGAPSASSPSPVRSVARRGVPAPSSADPRQTGALAAFRQSEGTVETLKSEYERRRSSLSPGTVAIIEKNLEIVDHAIAEARSALEADPSNPDLPLLLSGVYRQKAELLQDAVRLQSRS